MTEAAPDAAPTASARPILKSLVCVNQPSRQRGLNSWPVYPPRPGKYKTSSTRATFLRKTAKSGKKYNCFHY